MDWLKSHLAWRKEIRFLVFLSFFSLLMKKIEGDKGKYDQKSFGPKSQAQWLAYEQMHYHDKRLTTAPSCHIWLNLGHTNVELFVPCWVESDKFMMKNGPRIDGNNHHYLHIGPRFSWRLCSRVPCLLPLFGLWFELYIKPRFISSDDQVDKFLLSSASNHPHGTPPCFLFMLIDGRWKRATFNKPM